LTFEKAALVLIGIGDAGGAMNHQG
jgi:hypothetical protein